MNHFRKWKIFSLSPTLSAQPISAFFFFTPQPSNFFPAGPLPAPGPIRPSAPSTSLFHRQAGPARRDRLPLGSEPDSSLKPTEIPARAPPSPSWARTPRSVLRPYKRNPRPLETPNRSRSRRLRKNLARAAAIVEASRSFAAPPFRFVFSTTSLLRSSAVVRGTSPTFYLPPFRSVSPA